MTDTEATQGQDVPTLQAPSANGFSIPTDRDVWIDHMVTSLHLNVHGWSGAADHNAYLFHNRDHIDKLGEKWRLKADWDGTYTITNAQSGNELSIESHSPYRRVALSGRKNPAGMKWLIKPSGLFNSFSIHPADDKSYAIAPLHDDNDNLYLLPYQPYLTQFFLATERNV
jgi:hypothetical protein